ncbi:MAG: WG repeat-containing protein [Clostridia bacterium]
MKIESAVRITTNSKVAYYDDIHGIGLFFKVKFNGLWGVINQDGTEICIPKYDDISCFKNGFAKVKLNGLWGFVNQEGKQICIPRYLEVCDFENDFAKVKVNKSWGFKDENGLWGFIDKNGKFRKK